MQVFKREWIAYAKQTILWSIGLFLLIILAFYKVDGLSSVEGGMNTMIEALPPALQTIFGVSLDYTTGKALYSLIHLYLLIALSFHAVFLGSSIFAKEEHDKTFEFLYIKGMKRSHILSYKIIAGISIIIFINMICAITTMVSLTMMNKPMSLNELYPFLFGIFLAQLFFFSISLLLTFLLPNNRKAGMTGSFLILGMFLITMYAKMGGNVGFLNNLSIFHYMDANMLKNHIDIAPCSILCIISILSFILSLYAHEHRDLL